LFLAALVRAQPSVLVMPRLLLLLLLWPRPAPVMRRWGLQPL
jgi:hypothetical protein